MLLSGCSTIVPVSQPFPKAPDELMQKCSALDTIDKPTILLSEFITTVTKNYGKSHSCAATVEGWIDWYTDQKKIFDQVNKK